MEAAFYFTRRSFVDWSRVDYLWIIVMLLSIIKFSVWRHPFTTEDHFISYIFNKSVKKTDKLVLITQKLKCSYLMHTIYVLNNMSKMKLSLYFLYIVR